MLDVQRLRFPNLSNFFSPQNLFPVSNFHQTEKELRLSNFNRAGNELRFFNFIGKTCDLANFAVTEISGSAQTTKKRRT